LFYAVRRWNHSRAGRRFEQLNRAAGSLNTAARSGRDPVDAQAERTLQPAGGQHLDRQRGARHQTRLGEHGSVNDAVGLEAIELAEIDDRVFLAPLVVEPAQLGHALRQLQLATLETDRQPDAGARTLALLTAAARLALAGGDTAANALARLPAALGWNELVELHAGCST